MPKHYTIPEFSRTEVNKAGQTIITPDASEEEKEHALSVINNWRVSHNFPLNTFQMRLRNVTKKINQESLVAQRIKRLVSIKLKLENEKDMKMSQMQDVGGCRAIMKDVEELDALVDIYEHQSSGLKHKLHKEYNYITHPKESGYRGIHLVYKYRSDKSDDYTDMRIEIQMRTLMQHAWATAVETVGTFINRPLKSSIGEPDWLRFFSLMGSAMAISEGKPTVPDTSDNSGELRKEIGYLSKKLDVEGHLTTYRDSIQVLSSDKRQKNAYYYLLELDPSVGRVIIRSYSPTQLATASADYMTLEKRIANDKRDAVLVSADSFEALRLAYPNYYLDTDIFLRQLKLFTTTGQLSLF